MAETKLAAGTQTLPLRQAYEADCRCGRPLYWKQPKPDDVGPSAECGCGMAYYVTAMMEVKIEGVDRLSM